MNWFIKTMADESKYYPIFLGFLCVYALVGTVLFSVAGTFWPSTAVAAFILILLGAVVIGAAFRIAHNLCYFKVMQDDSKDSV